MLLIRIKELKNSLTFRKKKILKIIIYQEIDFKSYLIENATKSSNAYKSVKDIKIENENSKRKFINTFYHLFTYF